MLQATERRRALPGTCPGMPPRARKSQPPSPKHTGKQHHNSKTHHSYTPQLHTRPTKNTSSIHSHPPGCPKSPLLKMQSAFWAILAGVELTEGVLFGQAPPRAQKKKSRLNVTSIGTSEKRQLPTLPPGGAVPSALVCLTSLFGMGRGGSTLL